jgi:phosphoribosylformylglycinamidine synthase
LQAVKGSKLLLIDLGEGRNRMGGSALAQVYNLTGGESPDAPKPSVLRAFFQEVQALNRSGKLRAYHDRSDGGLFVTLAEMAFAGRCGLEIVLQQGRRADARKGDLELLFTEELGAVIQVSAEDAESVQETLASAGLTVHIVATVIPSDFIGISENTDDVFATSRTALQKIWSEPSFHIQSLRDNPECAAQEFALLEDAARPGLFVDAPFDLAERVSAPFVHSGRPRVAILREQGVNGQVEMGAACFAGGVYGAGCVWRVLVW